MYQFWYDYAKQNYGKKMQNYVNGHKKLYSIHKSRRHLLRYCQNVEARFDTSNYKLNRPLPKGKNKNEIGLMKDG